MIEERTTLRDDAVNRAKVYGFLSAALLFPQENWLEDLKYALAAATDLGYQDLALVIDPMDLEQLQSEYLRTLGVSGPLTYETEYGLDNAYRQSQELADLNGFYRAFGFSPGGKLRERPDHLATELEFMHLLALKEWKAPDEEKREICVDAQRNFLEDHLARWMEAFAIRVAFEAKDSLYTELARFAAGFVDADAARLGAKPEPLTAARLKPTPIDTSNECGECPIAEELG